MIRDSKILLIKWTGVALNLLMDKAALIRVTLLDRGSDRSVQSGQGRETFVCKHQLVRNNAQHFRCLHCFTELQNHHACGDIRHLGCTDQCAMLLWTRSITNITACRATCCRTIYDTWLSRVCTNLPFEMVLTSVCAVSSRAVLRH